MMGVTNNRLHPASNGSVVSVWAVLLLQLWEKLVPHGPEKPRGRCGHAVSILHSPLKGDQQTLLLVTGGFSTYDAWLLSIGHGASWREVSVTKGQ